ncbi:MAG TPA: isoprenylcysteine carboxylmethyltransferase family protein [Candidatus Bathyarchaeia archaeon]
MNDHARLGEEHPQCDRAQLLMLAAFICVWAADSFLLRLTAYGGLAPWPIRGVLGVALASAGAYLVSESHKLVIESSSPTLVSRGVYGLSRHPMYLGILLVYLGLAASTLSAMALAVWTGAFLVYDRLAAYEERDLEARLGREYAEYRGRVRRWLLF